MNKLCKVKFGSHLYGLNTQLSDLDYKGIYLPEKNDLLLGRVKKCIDLGTGDNTKKNTKEDVDETYYSLAYFVELALKGETVALDMLHSENPVLTSHEWDFLVQNRQKFYTKNLKAFMGYLKKQVAKYSVKGSRLAQIKSAMIAIDSHWNGLNDQRLYEIWDHLPEGDYLKKIDAGITKFYEVNSKRYQSTVRTSEVYDLLNKMYDGYGARAKLAESNDSIDWKAVSHAFRAGYQLRDIYTKGDFEYPLDETGFIKNVKLGLVDFKNEAQPKLELLMDEIDTLAKRSELPDEPDVNFWEKWLLDVYEDKLFHPEFHPEYKSKGLKP